MTNILNHFKCPPDTYLITGMMHCMVCLALTHGDFSIQMFRWHLAMADNHFAVYDFKTVELNLDGFFAPPTITIKMPEQ